MDKERVSTALGIRAPSEIEDEPTIAENTEILDSQEVVETSPAMIEDEDREYMEDLDDVRSNIRSVINEGSQALKVLMDVAHQSESPRAYEVVSTMMSRLVEANKEFANVAASRRFTKKELKAPEKAQETSTINNNLILTTADLGQFIKDLSKND